MNFILEKANDNDIGNIVHLVNIAYRGEQGWTKETDLIRGDRVTVETIESLMLDVKIRFFVAYSFGHLLCCVCLEQSESVANIGLLAVNPEFQNFGIGKSVLKQVEEFACYTLNVKLCVMQVISQRKELIAFYERRGYKKNGLVKPYPSGLNSGIPSVKGLTLDYLEKRI